MKDYYANPCCERERNLSAGRFRHNNRRTYLRSPMQNIGASLGVMGISGMCSHASNYGGTAEAKLFRP